VESCNPTTRIQEGQQNEYEEKLQKFISDNGIIGEYLVFQESCHSVEDAARALNTSPESIIKNICLVGEDKFIVAILKGKDRVDRDLVARTLGLSKVKTAPPQEILDRSGYPCGGVPSFGFNAIFLIDPLVMEMDYVYSGGGSTTSLIKITPEEILRANCGSVVRIRK
jgi:Cys-tRNA(Pro)/Cys-tRNA(Cys) deacylase